MIFFLMWTFTVQLQALIWRFPVSFELQYEWFLLSSSSSIFIALIFDSCKEDNRVILYYTARFIKYHYLVSITDQYYPSCDQAFLAKYHFCHRDQVHFTIIHYKSHEINHLYYSGVYYSDAVMWPFITTWNAIGKLEELNHVI